MKKSKRAISFLLVLAMVTSFSTVFAGAVNTESRVKAQALVSKIADTTVKKQLSISDVQKDMEVFENRMIDTDCISIFDVNEAGHVVYSYYEDGDDVVDYIDTWTDEEGSTCIRFKENDLVNILCFKLDGSIYLDGTKVEIETTNGVLVDEEMLADRSGEIEPMAGMYSYFSTSPFANTNFVDYTGSAMILYDSTKITKLANTVSKLGVNVVTTLVLNVWGSLISKLGQTFCKQVVKASVNVLCQKAPNATGVTFTDHRRPHSSNDTLRMLFRHDVRTVPDNGTTNTTYYYEDRRAT